MNSSSELCVFSKCISYWPEDGRPYVALGKTLIKQSRMSEARAVYEKGCQATQGENSYIWQVGYMFSSYLISSSRNVVFGNGFSVS